MTSAAPPNPRRGYKMGVAPTLSKVQPTTTQHASSRITGDLDRGLNKSATFHSPKSAASEDDPIVNIPLLSRRSPTSPQALRDAVASSEERLSALLGQVDRSLSGLETLSIDSQETIRPEEHPVPRFMLATSVANEDCMDIDQPTKHQSQHHHHTSDSGIGSSITDSDADFRDDAAQLLADHRKTVPFVDSVRSGINGTGSTKVQHALSAYACRQIQKYLILPILKEETLKAFHPLVNGIPARVGRKEITCLRDLEKVLLFLAPKFTESRSAFLRFCETSIQCLHTTVGHLNDNDQRRPTDRPYTNSYFLDLTEQVRQYATMISAARQRLVAGEAREGDEDTMNSKLSIEGGLGRTGRPAQLVRTSNGRSISMLDGEEVDLDALHDEAQSNGADKMDEDTLLSMARRRKNTADKPMNRCRECDKEFKRPCDLTKHEKSHSRPWKCSDPSCKYSQYGWPTEKERDRHINDKHSSTPAMYKCQFHPCPYESKRESNCKQHMEKAHGWAYVRSKNNGKKGRKQSNTTKAPPTPRMKSPGSNIFEASDSEFGDSVTSPYMQTSSGLHTANGSIAGTSPYLNMNEAYTRSPFEPNFTFDGPNDPTLTPQSPYTPASHHLSLDANAVNNNAALPSAYGGPPLEEMDMSLFGDSFDWSNMDTNYQTMNIQLFTPATSIDSHSVEALHNRQPSFSTTQLAQKDSKLSPGAHGSMMLYTPQEAPVDEGFAEFANNDIMGRPKGDFALFDDARPDSQMNLFESLPGLPDFHSQTWANAGAMEE